ncbi:MAG: AMP-binding protein [Pseudomonadota bacterium]
MPQIVHSSPLPDVAIPSTTITDLVLQRVAEQPDHIAIQDAGGGSSYTFQQLSDAIYSLAGGLQQRGIGPGKVVGIMAPNLPEYAIVFHAVAVTGGALTPVNPLYGPEEVHHQLTDAGASLLITIAPFAETALAAAEGTDVSEVVVMGDAVPGTTDFKSVFGAPIAQVPVDVDNDIVVLPYSSGTTGLPKGVMLTHKNLVANIAQFSPVFEYTHDDVALAFLPFFHIYGMQVLMNGLLSNGVTTVTMPRFDMVEALKTVQNLKVTRFFAVPPVILGLASAPVVGEFDLSSIKQVCSGAAPLGAELQAKAVEKLGCEVVQGFGMTELSPVSHLTTSGDYRPGTSGVTVSNTECRVVDPESGEDQPINERGELWVRGPQVMKGYLNNDTATAETITEDGWLRTGDIAIIDEHGHMSIVDRLKELIKYKGFQIAPAELEALLLTHPKVSDVAVIGIPDEEAGEVPKAFVTTSEGQSVTLEEIQTFIGEHLVKYKQVQQLAVIDQIPKSASGKILRKELRQQ